MVSSHIVKNVVGSVLGNTMLLIVKSISKFVGSENKKLKIATINGFANIYQHIREYLSTHSCVDCGESDIRCLEFDHVRGKKSNNVSKLISNVCSLNRIKLEIKKCDVRCANCHRKKTSDIQGWYKTGSITQLAE